MKVKYNLIWILVFLLSINIVSATFEYIDYVPQYQVAKTGDAMGVQIRMNQNIQIVGVNLTDYCDAPRVRLFDNTGTLMATASGTAPYLVFDSPQNLFVGIYYRFLADNGSIGGYQWSDESAPPSIPINGTIFNTTLGYYNDAFTSDNYVRNILGFNFDTVNINLAITSPVNNTNTNSTKQINYTLSTVNGIASCDYSINDALKLQSTNLENSTYNFTFSSSYWNEGGNNITINCSDSTSADTEKLTLFVDTTSPIITEVQYDLLGTFYDLNGSTIVDDSINITIITNDTNNYLMNYTLIRNGSGIVEKSVEVTGISANYSYNEIIDMSLFPSSYYILKVISSDAHTAKKIDYDKYLKETIITDGILFDDMVSVKVISTNLNSFLTKTRTDRKLFDLNFDSGTTEFEIEVEVEEETGMTIAYLDDQYGFMGHMIVGKKYWIDFENDFGLIPQIVSVTNHKVVLKFESEIPFENIEMKSIGLINTVTANHTFDYSFSLMNITLRDSVTKAVLSGINITVDYVGSDYQDSKNTETGNVNFSIRFQEDTETVTLISYQTNTTDYSIVLRELTLTQGTDKNLTIYLTNTSDADLNKDIQFKILDENKNILQGALLKIYKRDPSTNQFLLLTEIYSNANGEVNTKLALNTIFYRYEVVYDNNIVYLSAFPTSISELDDIITLNCVVGEGTTDYMVNYLDLDIYGSFTRTSDTTGYFTVVYNSPNEIEMCLDEYYIINNGTHQVNTSYYCENGTYNTYTSPSITSSVHTWVYGDVYIDYKQGYGKDFEFSMKERLGYDFGSEKDPNRLIIFFALVIICGVVFVFSPKIGIVFFIIGILVVSIMNFMYINPGWLSLIIGISLFTLITLMKNEKPK